MWRSARQIGVLIIGLGVILVGIVILPTLLPGWLTIFLGLGILASEFIWARRLLRWAKVRYERCRSRWRRSRSGGRTDPERTSSGESSKRFNTGESAL